MSHEPHGSVASGVPVCRSPDALGSLTAGREHGGRKHVRTLMNRMGLETRYRKPRTTFV